MSTRDERALVRHEEELRVGTEEHVVGAVRAHKRVEIDHVEHEETRSTEYGEWERAPANERDSGEIETLADGSVSIPRLEERLVVRKEVFVRERVILRKNTVVEREQIQAQLRREELELDADPAVDDRITRDSG